MPAVSTVPPLQRTPAEREHLAEAIAERLDGPMTALGIVFALLVVAETAIAPTGGLGTAFTVASWLLWAVFVAEFVVRMVVAPSTGRFLRRNWWQVIFLLLPFFRFVRVLARIRLRALTRVGRVVSSTVRSTWIAARRLSGRIAWLVTITAIVVLASSQLLYEFAGYPSYAAALHEAAYATVTGEPLTADVWLARVAEIVLAVYSVIVFAALAGMLGAYFLEARGSDVPDDAAPVPAERAEDGVGEHRGTGP